MIETLALTAALVLPTVPRCPPQDPPPKPELHGLPGTTAGTERWMVTFRGRPFDLGPYRAAIRARRPHREVRGVVDRLAAAAREHQAPFAGFVESLGGRVTDRWWLINGCTIEVPFARVEAVRRHPMVLRLHPDRPVHAGSVIRTSTNARNHAVDQLHAGGVRGQGVAVAIIDSGVDTDMALSGRPHRTFFVGGDITNTSGGGLGGSRVLDNAQLGPLPADDPINHGTGVAAVVAGEVWSASGAADAGHAPDARIVSYSILHTLLGGSSLSTIATAFQRAAADRMKYGIVAVNNSFSGSSDPTDPSQQAMDAAALHADLVVVVSAGNSGSLAQFSPSAANGLAVGAVAADSRVLARFSAIGPLTTDLRRTYPDLVANGVDLLMPKIDSEQAADFYFASGTSFAAPQVCGAAALYRSVRPAATALETKAAILATTEDISHQNATAPGTERNHYGLGYLRDDRLVALAQGGGHVTGASLTAASPSFAASVPVVADRYYAAVVAWNRQQLASAAWSDLDLVVETAGGELLGAGRSPRNLYEKVVFRAPESGIVRADVRAVRLENAAEPLALVVVEVPPQPPTGGVVAFGAGCRGTGRIPGVSVVAPETLRYQFGDLAMDVLMYADRREQFVFDAKVLPPAFTARALFLRIDPIVVPGPESYWSELEVRMAHAATTAATVANSFAANLAGPVTRVVDRRRVQLPVITHRGASPEEWLVEVPFDRPFTFQGAGAQGLAVEFIHHAASAVAPTALYPTNGVWARQGSPEVSWVMANSRTATSGGKLLGRGPVIGFAIESAGGVVPVIGAVRAPAPWTVYAVDLERARPSSPATLLTGLSDVGWGGTPLPFDLGVLGAPTCALLVSPDVFQPGTTDPQGFARFELPVPRIPGIVQSHFFQQAMVLDPAANALGAVTSNGLRATVGDR